MQCYSIFFPNTRVHIWCRLGLSTPRVDRHRCGLQLRAHPLPLCRHTLHEQSKTGPCLKFQLRQSFQEEIKAAKSSEEPRKSFQKRLSMSSTRLRHVFDTSSTRLRHGLPPRQALWPPFSGSLQQPGRSFTPFLRTWLSPSSSGPTFHPKMAGQK